ncbi:dihydrolipoamide acetyltransferase family protein [Homoserinimonas sp. OAct 916]|uniref:dihydrolipoamide acetyltransferase family protein n=1 Tax=Homoserinimonas sp. OAct 916 TaxID=2211450 RepID=UPI0018E59C2B|nr:dihydrolipoamide acetyltransferase family protein [Homoserinimonas sp. OAct 916]
MSTKTFNLPDLGEGLTESDIVAWKVAVGDTVELNQIIAEVETAKALVELPSPYAGVVKKLYEEAGSTVRVGAPIVAIDVPDGAPDGADGPNGDDNSGTDQKREVAERNPVLVGYGAPVDSTDRPRRRARAAGFDAVARQAHRPVSAEPAMDPAVESEEAHADRAEQKRAEPVLERPRSTPPVRKLARDEGVDLTKVTGTGERGLITRQDVLDHLQVSPTMEPDITIGDPAAIREVRTPIRGVRKHTAQAMVASAFTAPHVTEFLTIDVTPTMELVDRLRASRDFAGSRPGLLAVVAKAMCIAAARTPSVNTRWDDKAQEIIQFNYVNLGIAVASERGLVVPNIKDAERMSLRELVDALAVLTETSRAGRATPRQLTGGTISITNVGVFGVDAGTPVLNPGEAAILAIGAVRRMPWEHRGEVALRQVMTLSLSFDHRLVDGEQGSRFLTDVGTILSDPARVLTMV